MVLKEKDSIEERLQALEMRLAAARAPHQRQQIEFELRCQRSGLRAEKEAAYQIDFHLRDSRNWAVIHDLKLECNGRVAQIDHLLIDRLLEIYVVESKSFRFKVRHANGGWERLSPRDWEGIPSPVEQNDRHIAVLKELIQDLEMCPKKLGVSLQPAFFNIVVVQSSCSIVGKFPEDSRVYRIDQLVRKIRAEDPSPMSLLKLISEQTLEDFARRLVANHRPAPTCRRVTTESGPVRESAERDKQLAQRCECCGGPLSNAEANYCRARKGAFAGKLMCRKCQGYVPKQNGSNARSFPTRHSEFRT